jgi:serine/threonine protein kinase/formylglycine-generating enzyme required for sulfatase activity/dienelactone hydrolase
MGVVYKAEDTKLKRSVALKFLPPELTRDKDATERFFIEAQAAAALSHNNIITVHEINEHEDQIYIVTEYIEGQNLKEKIQAGPLPIEESLKIAVEIADGLQEAHEKGIVHRDIKSANIMITEKGQVKIMDFGLAKLKGKSKLTKVGTTVGTAAYMSPEQALGKEVDHRTDIWSLGVVLYEMLTGELPFKGQYEQAVIYSIMNEEPEPVSHLGSGIPEELTEIVTRSLKKERAQRYGSIKKVLKDLNILRHLDSPTQTAMQSTGTKAIRLFLPKFVIPILLILGVLSFFTIRFSTHMAQIRRAKDQLIPEITRLIDNEEFIKAYTMTKKAQKYIPQNPTLTALFEKTSRKVSIKTVPSDADIYFMHYLSKDGSWEYLGKSPIKDARVPIGFFHWKFEKEGYKTIERAVSSGSFTEKLVLDKKRTLPAEMIRIPNDEYEISLIGTRNLEAIELGDYLIDKFEVTNRQFKEFVDDGGYQKQIYWKQEFTQNGKTISWKTAMSKFKDSTGRPGPRTWEVGTYPEGRDDYPVCGISWYEAEAFARYVGKELPTIYHWAKAAGIKSAPHIVPLSNFSKEGPAPAGRYRGMGPYGTFDMAGNVKEWCFNAVGENRFILGGAWDEPEYMCLHTDTRSPFDRSINNGFRCMKYLHGNKVVQNTRNAVAHQTTTVDYSKLKPVSDDLFRAFTQIFSYDRTSLNSVIESRDESYRFHIKEKISFDAAYGNERIPAYLFIPKNSDPPYQTVIFFPGALAFTFRSSSDGNKLHSWDAVDFVLKAGRAVLYPIFKSYYERGDGFSIYDQSFTLNAIRDHLVMWRKDLGRSIDYIESRSDLDPGKICFYGSSWGSYVGIYLIPLEKRLKTAILRLVGYSVISRKHPELEQVNFAVRIQIPVLILNGKYDTIFPYKTSQHPLFQFIDTPKEHKRMVLFDVGHAAPRPRSKAIQEVLDWLDRYLGPVTKK